MGEWKALKKASGTDWKELERESGSGWKALLWEIAFEDQFTGSNGDPPDSGNWDKRNTPTIQNNELECGTDEYVVSQSAYDIKGRTLENKVKVTSGETKSTLMVGDVKTTALTAPESATGQDGYSMYRGTGNRMRIFRIVNGSSTSIYDNATFWSGYSISAWHYYRIEVASSSPYLTKFWVKKSDADSWVEIDSENWYHSSSNMYIYVGVPGTGTSITSRNDYITLE